MTKKMNRVQIKYFEQRMHELLAEKESVLANKKLQKEAELGSPEARVRNYMRTHKKIVSQQLFEIAMEVLNSDSWYKNVGLRPSKDNESRVPQFIKDIYAASQADLEQLNKSYRAEMAKLEAKFTALMDSFYLSDCPDCAALMDELRNLSL